MNIEEKMFELAEDCLRSGKTQKQYSQEVGVGYAKFNYWVCRIHPTKYIFSGSKL